MIAIESDSPEKAPGRAQMRDWLERKLDELPENLRTVFLLRAVEEFSADEIAGFSNVN